MSKTLKTPKPIKIVEITNGSNIDLGNIEITGGSISNVSIGNLGPVTIVSTEITNGPLNILGSTFSSTQNIVFNATVELGDITIQDNNISSASTVNFTSPVIVKSISGSGEYLQMSTVFITPSNEYNETFINLTGSTDITGSLSSPTVSFFEKRITILGLNGNKFILNFNNLIGPTGSTGNHTVTFDSNGQGETFIWDLSNQRWYIRNGGCQVLQV